MPGVKSPGKTFPHPLFFICTCPLSFTPFLCLFNREIFLDWDAKVVLLWHKKRSDSLIYYILYTILLPCIFYPTPPAVLSIPDCGLVSKKAFHVKVPFTKSGY